MDPTQWLDWLIGQINALAPKDTFFSFDFIVRGLIAVVLVCLICGAVGSLVVGNRMAFFSDALAHCAFAGIALGLLLSIFFAALAAREWIIAVMVAFGILVGVAIAFVRETTNLANDTVIGVFFAGAIGFGAMLFKALAARRFISPETFLFGDPLLVSKRDTISLFCLALITGGVLTWIYNRLVFTSFNTSLARSRQIPVRFCNYAFIILLALIVNMSVTTVGALLINGLLVVPAATANNLARNMRQLFWMTLGISVAVGLLGPWLSWELALPNPQGPGRVQFGWGGTIVVVSVLLFIVSMVVGPRLRGRQAV